MTKTPTRPTPPIETRYKDARGKVRMVSAETRHLIQSAIDDDDAESDRHPAARVIRIGERATFDGAADLVHEDGTRESLAAARSAARNRWRSRIPSDVPAGYHTLEFHDSGRRMTLIVAPKRCHLPENLRIWSWAVQLYSARSRRSWGMGDFSDLTRVARWARDLGCGLLLLNPLHAATPVVPQEASPYSPSTRRYLNPLYIAIDDVPGASDLRELPRLRAAGRALNRLPEIERDKIFRLKMRALRRIYRTFSGDAAFEAFARSEGASLRQFATFCVLAETFGGNWGQWPSRYRCAHSSDVRRFAETRHHRVRFFQWLQWHADRQLGAASLLVPVMQDLPIGIDPGGADAWAWQDVLARGMAVGAPPDEFNTRGQNWGLPPFVPHRLRRAAYRPFIETIRGTMRHAGGLRIDHVMGLYRLFWIPEGMDASQGAYVRNDAADLLGIIALESERAQAIVAGEDLGTVEPRAQRELMDAGVLSYRLLWFEKGHPSGYPRQAMAAVTTHDLPTIAGLWNGSDLEAQRRLGLDPNEEGTKEIHDRLSRLTRSPRDAASSQVIVRAHRLLSKAPSVVVSATLEDAAEAEGRPNMPGTMQEWPNWKQPLPKDLDALVRSGTAKKVAAALGAGRRRKAAD